MGMPSDLVGKRYGKLVVCSVAPNEKLRSWRCLCDCGQYSVVLTARLNNGNTKSCGCVQRGRLGKETRTHGLSNSRLTGYANRTYGVWQAMHDRCRNKNRSDYHRYGGRGITVCKRWTKFEHFLADMGAAPSGLTLDRRDNNKGYSPSNCRWASRLGQANNSSRIKYIKIGKEIMSLTKWLQKTGVTVGTYYARKRRGFSDIQAILEIPVAAEGDVGDRYS